MATNFNFIDNINTQTFIQFASDKHDHAIETTGRKAHIFLLDRVETERSNVYKEELHGRIYLPHFTQRALYKTNTFVSQLNAKGYIESEQNMEMEFNFARMVNNIHNVKQKTAGKLVIKNTSKIPLEITINFKKLIVKNHIHTLYEKELKEKVYDFIDIVNKETDLIDLSYTGDGDELVFADKIDIRKLLPRREHEIILNNSVYRNTGDVINLGDLILSDRMKLYQVVGAYPKNDSYSQYISWTVSLELFNLAKADGLPNDYVELIKENQYGLDAKYKLS